MPVPADSSGDRSEVEVLSDTQRTLTEKVLGGGGDKYVRLVIAALSGVPGVGVLAALASFNGEIDQ